jgi:hypothetical protein
MSSLPKTPDEVLSAVKEAVAKCPENLDKSISEAERAVKSLPGFSSYSDGLVSQAIAGIVYQVRRSRTSSIKRLAAKPEAVADRLSDGVRRAFRSAYEYFIAGRMLGNILGSELPDIALTERKKANGVLANVELLDRLADIVPENKTVKQVVSQKKLLQMIKAAQKKYKTELAGA